MSLLQFLDNYGTSGRMLPRLPVCYDEGSIVVCGDAGCIWEDLACFNCCDVNSVAKPGWQFMTVNRLVEVFPGRIEHAYSNVAKVLMRHVDDRRDEYAHEFGPPQHTHSRTVGTEYVWPWHGAGTSGLGAVLTAVALGYERIVLAGMPLTNMHHNGEPPWRVTRFTREVEDNDEHWKRAIKLAFDGKVKSLSGRTKDWLGAPTN